MKFNRSSIPRGRGWLRGAALCLLVAAVSAHQVYNSPDNTAMQLANQDWVRDKNEPGENKGLDWPSVANGQGELLYRVLQLPTLGDSEQEYISSWNFIVNSEDYVQPHATSQHGILKKWTGKLTNGKPLQRMPRLRKDKYKKGKLHYMCYFKLCGYPSLR